MVAGDTIHTMFFISTLDCCLEIDSCLCKVAVLDMLIYLKWGLSIKVLVNFLMLFKSVRMDWLLLLG